MYLIPRWLLEQPSLRVSMRRLVAHKSLPKTAYPYCPVYIAYISAAADVNIMSQHTAPSDTM